MWPKEATEQSHFGANGLTYITGIDSLSLGPPFAMSIFLFTRSPCSIPLKHSRSERYLVSQAPKTPQAHNTTLLLSKTMSSRSLSTSGVSAKNLSEISGLENNFIGCRSNR